MIEKQYRYLINNEVMQGGEMPKMYGYGYSHITIPNWFKTLVKLECSESELDKIKDGYIPTKILDITSITTVKDNKVYFKEVESEIDLWVIAFKEADIYAQKQDAKDREENNIQESGYWFWRDNYLKQRFTITRK